MNDTAPAKAPAATATDKTKTQTDKAGIKVWGHSTIFYWWIVWVYGFVCAGITAYAGKTMTLTDGLPFKMYEGSWLGMSFLALLLFVIMFSAWKVKGYIVLIALLALGLGVELLHRFGMWQQFLGFLPEPVVYMNLAFYLIFSGVLFLVWMIAVFGIDPLTYWRFQPGQVQEKHVLDHVDDKLYPTLQMTVYRKPVDFLRKALGLFRTGDLVISIGTGGDKYAVTIPNVWGVDAKIQRITSMIHKRSG